MKTIKEQTVKLLGNEKILLKGSSVLVACSGGPDSMCLLDILRAYSEEEGFSVGVITIDHSLRPESKEEVKLIRRYCMKYNLPFYVFEEDIIRVADYEGVSIETAGRNIRYKRFYNTAQREGYEYIALGHHKNDQCESILGHIIRGSGLSGLGAMKVLEGKLLRPLLGVTKDEIIAALEREKIAYAWDETNDQPIYQRNRLRLELMPLLKTFNPQVEEALVKMAHLATMDNDYLEGEVEAVYEKIVKSTVSEVEGQENNTVVLKVLLDRNAFKELPKAIRYRLWRRVAKDFYPYGVTPSLKNVETMDELLFGKNRKEFLSKWMKILVEYDTIYFAQLSLPYEADGGPVSYVPKTKEGLYAPNPPKGTFIIPRTYAEKGLLIRPRESGDRIVVCNKERQIKGHKKVKKYVIDKKVPQAERRTMMWLVAGDSVLCEATSETSFALYDPHERDYVMGFFEEERIHD